ncbi:3TM-type holin [Magnetovibrio sp. PR-2]|uniref:3TM-type holin n=1 Tax=Magnetovibrio sp. PR-2 TaxID=3120356 RepID=UPI002FCE3BCE
MIQALLAPLLNIAGNVASEFIEDKDKLNAFKAQLASQAINKDTELAKAARDVVVAEAKGESWLQRNWRPIAMLTFLGMLLSYWLGFGGVHAPETVLMEVFALLKIGIGGYIVGRSAEKAIKTYKE